MNICIPIQAEQNLQSQISAHFGSAPFFMIIDVDTNILKTIPNSNASHGYGMCVPLQALQNEKIDAVVVSGIGTGAFQKLKNAHINVYVTHKSVVQDILEELQSGQVKHLQNNQVCAHHGHQHHRHEAEHGYPHGTRG